MLLSMWFDFWIWSNAWVQNNKLLVLVAVIWLGWAGYYAVKWLIDLLYEPPIPPAPSKLPSPPTDLVAEISLQTPISPTAPPLPPTYKPFVSVAPGTSEIIRDQITQVTAQTEVLGLAASVQRVPFVQQVPTVQTPPKKPKVRGVEIVKSPCDIIQENGKIKSMIFTGHLSCHVFQDPESQGVGTGLLVDDRFVGRDLLWLKGALDAAEIGDNINIGQVRITVEILDEPTTK